ncbi:MAG: CsbD family protein [Leptolyngbyaceae cyanobacterium SM1_1_3]|nr:CsbD family protein [Leptolyngbyaceae cyanobacterium SM1_1_3]NJM85587.1 CsbD family protein [Leptolyngbyaceae cyanobacterium RM2_2_21]NJN04900.1 CsbD family protein [Leptolyngbyaceae cyanobacterium RM1_1_2]NJO10834.1 CsbD family protein [Leptolyngbyaceae cyanobacterium SL_1_1]
MKTPNLINCPVSRIISAVRAKLAIAFALLLAVGSVLVVSASPAVAAVGTDASRVAPGSPAAAEVVQERAKREFNEKLGAGTSDKVEGTLEDTVGKAKRQLGDFGTEMDGTTDRVEGQMKQTMGRAKDAADRAGDKAEDAGESLIDNIKDFFN